MAESELLDNESKIKAIDRSQMLSLVENFPEMLREAEKICSSIRFPKWEIENIDQIFIAGLGGSGIAGNIVLNLYYSIFSVPLSVVRNYSLPYYATEDSLIFIVSYSGETEEALSVLKDAQKRNLKIIVITSGGKLRQIAESKNYPLFLIPLGYPPRAALPFLLISLLYSLEKMGFIPASGDALKETILLLEKLKESYRFSAKLRSNPAKQLAKKLLGKIPIILATEDLTSAAGVRWKTQFNENSKVTALFNVFPELNHNEIVNLAQLKRGAHNFSLIVLRDEGEPERIKKRIEITKSLLSAKVGGITEIWSQGKSLFTRLSSLIFFGDFVSTYLAILQEIDPTPVEVISRLKKELQR